MDIKKYIASGILEQYVLGKLSPEEAAEVERHAGAYPEIRAELDRIEQALEQYAVLLGQQPPAGTLSDILEKLDDTAPPAGKGSSNLNRIFPWVTGIAAILALIAAFLLNHRLRDARDTIQEQQAQLQTACDTIINERDSLQLALDFLQSYSTRPIVMRGTDLSPSSVATVFYNSERQQALLSVADLPTPPTGQQYQLWAIVDGDPVDMGVFDLPVQARSFTEVPYVENAQAFAVTLEPEGGSEQPTLEQMYIIGNVSAG